MKIAVTGASGFLGSALVPALRADGHEVLRLVRRAPRTGDEVRWDPARHEIDLDGLRGVEGVVHLAGAGLGDRRWTTSYKRTILDSRVDGTSTISEAIAALDPLPRVFLSGSAIGWYGDTGEGAADESAPSGHDFLADVVRRWEACTAPAEAAGVRVVKLRSGVVMAAQGGTLGGTASVLGIAHVKPLTLYRLGLGGPLGSGRQWMSWVSLDDEIGAIRFLLTAEHVSGPVNVTAPHPVRNREWAKALGAAVHRPAVLPVPALALRLALGEFAQAGVLMSQRVLPDRLQEAGYRFQHTHIREALAAAVGR